MKILLGIIIKATLLVAVTVGFVDMAGFFLWVASGQKPPDSVYVGALTTHVVRSFLKEGK